IGGREFENRAASAASARRSRSVEIAGGIHDQPAEWKLSIGSTGEAIDGLLRPARSGRRQLINRATTVRTAVPEYAVKVAGCIADNAAPGLHAVSVVPGGVKDVLGPATT